MVKKYISQKPNKKIKKLNNAKHKVKKGIRAKRIKTKKLSKNNLIEKEPKNNPKTEETTNVFSQCSSSYKTSLLCMQ